MAFEMSIALYQIYGSRINRLIPLSAKVSENVFRNTATRREM